MSNIVSELSQIPDFQSRWLRGGKNIGFISYYILLAERMTCSCTTVRLRLYDYIGYGCTTLELWLYNYKGLVVQLQNSVFSTKSTNIDNILNFCYLHIFAIFQIFSRNYFPGENQRILKRFNLEFVRFFSIILPFIRYCSFLKCNLSNASGVKRQLSEKKITSVPVPLLFAL